MIPNTKLEIIRLLGNIPVGKEVLDGGLDIKVSHIADYLVAAGVKIPVLCKECKYSRCNPVTLTYTCGHPCGLRGWVNEGFYFCYYGEGKNNKEENANV